MCPVTFHRNKQFMHTIHLSTKNNNKNHTMYPLESPIMRYQLYQTIREAILYQGKNTNMALSIATSIATRAGGDAVGVPQ